MFLKVLVCQYIHTFTWDFYSKKYIWILVCPPEYIKYALISKL